MIVKILLLILLFLLAFIIFSLPLFFGLLIMGRPHSLFKTGMVNFIVILISSLAMLFLPNSIKHFSYIIIAILAVIIYRESFRLKWWKALFVYMIQALITYIMYTTYSFYF